jgi:hypothetical protein
MAQFLVLSDYQDTARKLSAGTLIDDTTMPLSAMQDAGIAVVAYSEAVMAPVVRRFLAQRSKEFAKPDLLLLLLLSISGAAIVNSSTGASVESRL